MCTLCAEISTRYFRPDVCLCNCIEFVWLSSSGFQHISRAKSCHCRTVQDWSVSRAPDRALGGPRNSSCSSTSAGCGHFDHWPHTQVWGLWAWWKVFHQPWFSNRSVQSHQQVISQISTPTNWTIKYQLWWQVGDTLVCADGHPEFDSCNICLPAGRRRGEGGADWI